MFDHFGNAFFTADVGLNLDAAAAISLQSARDQASAVNVSMESHGHKLSGIYLLKFFSISNASFVK